MKNLLFWCIGVILSSPILAQAPQAFNYQGIARDGNGTPFTNRNITLRIAILQGALPGTEVYQESHNAQTNKLGIFTVEVGHGHSQLGAFEDVDWGSGEHYVRIEMDAEGGTNYKLLGESQLLSVPYALYAGNGSGGENLWEKNTSGIDYPDGNVGIGTTNPQNKISIQGNDANGEGRVLVSMQNESTSNRSWAALRLAAGDGDSRTYLTHHALSYDYDGDKYTDFGQFSSNGRGLILRSDRQDGIIKFLAGGNILSPAERMRITGEGFIGIGTENPRQKLTIQGEDNAGEDIDYIFLNNTSLGTRSGVLMALSAGDNASQTTIGHHAETYTFDNDKYTDFGQVHSTGAGLILRASSNEGVIKFMMGHNGINSSTERMRITNAGYVGIGTENPESRLQVADGDIYIEDINNGVIMKSPNGGCWRMTINDDGSIQTTSITCPQ